MTKNLAWAVYLNLVQFFETDFSERQQILSFIQNIISKNVLFGIFPIWLKIRYENIYAGTKFCQWLKTLL